MRIEDERIISWENLLDRIGEGIPFRDPVVGLPKADIFFDAHKEELGFTVAVDSEIMPTIEPANISINIVRDPKTKLEVRVGHRELFREFYSFCVEILDAVQLNSIDVALAVDQAWGAWAKLLDVNSVLSKEKQLGLIGELWLLERLSKSRSWSKALDSWHDTANSEHDFCLDKFDIEVKSTTSEDRIHMIGSEKQLMPSLDRPLYLLSHQFTSAARHAAGAISLNNIIDRIRAQLSSPHLEQQFEQRLQLVGWKAEHTRHYSQMYLSRTAPSLVLVDDECPRLTPQMLSSLGLVVEQRLKSVSYRIDVTNLGFPDGSAEFYSLIPN